MTIFDGETFDAILERMLARIPSDFDKREGSVIYDMLAPAALELAQTYAEMDNVLDLGFADGAYGEFLDRKVAEQGMARKEAVKSSGTLTFYGLEGTDIPADTRVSTVDGIYFVTTETVTITNGVAKAAAEAEVGGVDGNVGVGEITDLDDSDIDGLTSVNNDAEFTGGFDEESDELLYTRYQEHVSRPITSGNKYQYESWAKEVNGIYDAKCYPLWNGPGTVKVVLVNEDKRSPSQSVITAAETYIESVRPIGADVTVVGVAEIPIDVTAKLTLVDGASIDDVTGLIISNIDTYLKTVAFEQTTVRYSQIGNAILDAEGVVDYADLKVNGSVGNIITASDEVPFVGAVVVTQN